ncbi:ATP-binding cassette domain-containing protein [Candidatus Bipolaricaulota bacterium]|nr:ATP-binding cassette domain-containing protein [Candidatus Bipolaricaulota bacterium]
MNPTGIKIEDLEKDLGEFKIKNASLKVNRGDYFMVLGPTGAGKTVLLETIAGIHSPDAGKITIAGRDVKDVSPENRNIGFVYQDYMLFPHLTALENVMYGLQARSVSDPKTKAREVIDLLDLTPLIERYPRTLSGGESQKVAVARAIAYRPKLLLLDEPTAALDPQTKEKVRSELAKLHEELNVTTMHVTHDQAEAKILGDTVAVMMGGEIKHVGTVKEVFNRPKNETVANFVGVENILRGRITNYSEDIATIDTGNFEMKAITEIKEGRVNVYLRPEDIFISDRPQKTSARNNVKGQVESVTHLGNVYRVRVDTGLSCFVTKQSVEEFSLEEKKEIYTSFKATAAQVKPVI